jgi:hypothetical protein
MMVKPLTPEELKALSSDADYKCTPIPEMMLDHHRLNQLFCMIVQGDQKPDNLTVVEDANWNSMQDEVLEAGPNTEWHIPDD